MNVRQSFGLTGPSTSLDPRTHAFRGDLADIALAGRLFSPHYVEPIVMACAQPHAAMCAAPGGEQTSELLAGEAFHLLDRSGGWAWGWSAHDHYVGYVKDDALVPAQGDAPAPPAGDPVTIARGFLDMTYLWGGRGGAGIDCSGLVQRAVSGIGVLAQRDSDMQAASLGLALSETDVLQPGDIVFFPGHVGMMADAETLIHATKHHGCVIEEPLGIVVERISAKRDGIGITVRRRVMP